MSTILSAAARLPLVIGLCLILNPGLAAAENQASLDAWVDKATALVPHTVNDCRAVDRVAGLDDACRAIDTGASLLMTLPEKTGTDEVLRRRERLLAAKMRVDRLREQLFALRTEFVKEAAGEPRWLALRNYLRIMNALTDLSGRLRFEEEEAFTAAAYRVAASPPTRDKLIDLLIRYKSAAGA